MTEFTPTPFDGSQLSVQGLNLQAVINLADLPENIAKSIAHSCDRFADYSQLILIGHGGRLMWQKVKQSGLNSSDPIDNFCRYHITKHFSQRFEAGDFEIIFPTSGSGHNRIGLQALGEIAGWHNATPFRVGINREWGSWFAYRAVILLKNSDKALLTSNITKDRRAPSPCTSCATKSCIQVCPGSALDTGSLDFNRCIAYRKQLDSACKDRCIALMACPVAKQHQYSLEQIQYHYSLSMRFLRRC